MQLILLQHLQPEPQLEAVSFRLCWPKPLDKAERGGPGPRAQGPGVGRDRAPVRRDGAQSTGREEGHSRAQGLDAGPLTEREKSGRGGRLVVSVE